MASPANTLKTIGSTPSTGPTGASSMREDLSDIITRLDPTDTPFITLAGTSTAKNDLNHDWLTTAIRAPGQNQQSEGNVFVPTAAQGTVRLTNTCQIMTEVASVSDTASKTDTAGNAGSIDFQVVNKSLALKRDAEARLVGYGIKSLTDPRAMQGLANWAGVVSVAADGDIPPGANGTAGVPGTGTTALSQGTARDLTPSMIDDVMQRGWAAGAKFDTAMMGPGLKRSFDAMPQAQNNLAYNEISTQPGPNANMTYVRDITWYKTSFGTIKVIMNQWMDATTLFLFDSRPQYRPKVATIPGRNFSAREPQLNFDGTARAIVWEGTLEVPAPNAVGMVNGANAIVPA